MKLKQQYETEIFIGGDGYIVITQPDTNGNEDQNVILSPDQLEMLVLFWNRSKSEAYESWNDGVEG